MEKQALYTILRNDEIARDVYAMRLEGPTGMLVRPGQFINIAIEGFYLRRPISVCDWDEGGIDIIYKVLGRGTAVMAGYRPGKQLDVLAGLGNGFDVAPAAGKQTVLVGGGVGVPPLYGLAKAIVAAGEQPPIITLGFCSEKDVFYRKELENLGCTVQIATEDGSCGELGFVTRLLEGLSYQYYYACGPQGMLAAVHRVGEGKGADGQLSFEERMGCGFGACMGCSCETLVGAKRICVDGPVFPAKEVAF